MKQSGVFLSTVAAFVALLSVVDGLTCYFCNALNNESPCYNDVESQASGPCEGVCIIYRTEWTDSGKVTQLTRHCFLQIDYVNKTVPGTDGSVSHITVCDSDLCNSGDGSPDSWLGDLQCYSCLANGTEEAESLCVVNPQELEDGVKTCAVNEGYCTIARSELQGKFSWLERGCAAEPKAANVTERTVEGFSRRVTHYSACQEGLCNGWDGVLGGSSEDEALQCYECYSQDEESHCAASPARDKNLVINCPHKYCSVRRTENNGKFSSLRRLCEEVPPYINETVTEGEATRRHYTSCAESLCNSGDGVVEETKALQCYECYSQDEESTCVANPERDKTLISNCPHKYCSIRRTEKQGVFSSLWRLCEELPQYMNETVKNGDSAVFYTSCQADLCNAGGGVIDEMEDEGLRCFTCSSVGADQEDSACVTNPAKMDDAVIKCSATEEFCTITKMEIGGEFAALARGCAENPQKVNVTEKSVVGGVIHRTHHFACKDDLCNIGDGIIEEGDDEILSCYECFSSDEDSQCVNNPAGNQNFVVACPHKYCSIRRTERRGKFRSIWRLCEDTPPFMNESVETRLSTIVHYTSCQSNTCNGGEGVLEVDNDDDGDGAIAMPSSVVFATCLIVALLIGH